MTPLKSPEYAGLMRSAKKYGYNLVTLTSTHCHTWRAHKPDKLKSLYLYLQSENIQDNDVVFFFDGIDAVFGKGNQCDLVKAFIESGAEILMSAEANCYPPIYKEEYVNGPSWTGGAFEYINVGMYAGRGKAIMQMLKYANTINETDQSYDDFFRIIPDTEENIAKWGSRNEYFKHNYPTGRCDQNTLKYIYINGIVLDSGEKIFPIQIDTQCKIFQNLTNNYTQTMDFIDGKWRNTLTGTEPFVFHGPGNTGNILPICKMLDIPYNIVHNKAGFSSDHRNWKEECRVDINVDQHTDEVLELDVVNFYEGLTPIKEKYKLITRPNNIIPKLIKR